MRKLFFVLLLAVLMLSFVVAVKPSISGDFTEGLIINYHSREFVQQGMNYRFHFHVFNVSTGAIITNATTSCRFDLYNQSGKHIYVGKSISYDAPKEEWEVIPDSNNFSSPGEYSYIVQCNTTNTGGFDTVNFEVSRSGGTLTTAQGTLMIVFFFGGLLLFVLCGVAAWKFPWNDWHDESGNILNINHFKFVKVLLVYFTYLMLLFIVGMLRGIMFQFIPEVGIYMMFNWAYWIMMYALWPLTIIAIIYAMVRYIHDKKLEDAFARRVPLR